MKHQSNVDPQIVPYNAEVRKAYFKILKQAKALIATAEQHELRCSYVHSDRTKPTFLNKLHEFVNPIICLCLMSSGEEYTIQFGFELYGRGDNDFSDLASKFMRILYKVTSEDHTAINIEGCVSTYNVITQCTDLFDYMDERGKSNHSFELIPYKAATIKRKLRKVA